MSLNLTHFDLNLLVVLDALLTEGSVTRAAERLYVSQPAVSGSLNRLREIFKDELFVRVGRQMELTARAKALAGPVRSALLMVQAALEVEQGFDAATAERSFRIAMSDYCALTILPHLVRLLAAQAPKIRLVVESYGTASFDRLDAGDIDFCITLDERRAPTGPRHPDLLRRTALYDDRFVCVVAADHPLHDELSVEAYRSFPHVLVLFGDDGTTLDNIAFEHAGITTPVNVAVPNFSAVLFQLPGTPLIAVVPGRIVKMFAPLIRLRTLRPPITLPIISETLMWHKRSDADPGHLWIRTRLAEIGATLNAEHEAEPAAAS